jgi:hypothetical protein
VFIRTGYETLILKNPNKFLNRVVKVKLNFISTGRNSLFTSELNLLNEVLVGELSETATLISIKEDVINPERSGSKRTRKNR